MASAALMAHSPAPRPGHWLHRLVEWAASVALCTAVCGSSASCERRAKAEAAALVFAVDRYRVATDDAKPEAESAVSSTACTVVKVCDAKSTCLAALTPTTEAIRLKAKVMQGIADLKAQRMLPGEPEALELPRELDQAERLLNEGHAKMGDCEKKLTDLRLEQGL